MTTSQSPHRTRGIEQAETLAPEDQGTVAPSEPDVIHHSPELARSLKRLDEEQREIDRAETERLAGLRTIQDRD